MHILKCWLNSHRAYVSTCVSNWRLPLFQSSFQILLCPSKEFCPSSLYSSSFFLISYSFNLLCQIISLIVPFISFLHNLHFVKAKRTNSFLPHLLPEHQFGPTEFALCYTRCIVCWRTHKPRGRRVRPLEILGI